MTPFDEPHKQHILTPEQLDRVPLDFGKWRGKSAEQLAEGTKDQQQYVVWAYENVIRHNRPVFCSEVLYKECGGKFKSAREQAAAKALAGRKPHPYNFKDDEDDVPF